MDVACGTRDDHSTVEDAQELEANLPEGADLPETEGAAEATIVTVDLEIERDTVRVTTLLLVSEKSWIVFTIIDKEELAGQTPDEPSRYVSLLADGDADLTFDPADGRMDWLVVDKDGTTALQLRARRKGDTDLPK